ncbi:MAG: hypothetical protein JWM98_3380 [Thermoleophilia bacterium]|nr:hypothetical protein [Thermoleophilia bacterium]
MDSGDHPRGTDAATPTAHHVLPDGVEDVAADEEAELAAVLGGPSDAPAGPAPSRDEAPRTRDVLSAIAEREHAVPVHRELERRERKFVRWLLVSLVIAVAALYGAMWWLDPISVTGRQTRFSVVENGGVRQAKLDLMDRLPAPPGVLVLGSSRSMKLNPVEIHKDTGEDAFNAGVSGGTAKDMYLYARYADELWGKQDATFPHLVIGVVSDVFRYSGTSSLDPRLKKFLPKSQSDSGRLEVAKELLQAKTVEGAARAVHRVVKHDGVGALLHPEQGAGKIDAELATTGKQRGNQLENLSPRGMQLFDPGIEGDKSKLPVRVERQMRTFARGGYEADPNFTGIDARSLELFRRMIKMANSHGDVPTVWITPFQPGALKYLPKDKYEARNRTYKAALRKLLASGDVKFTFVDETEELDSFGGNPEDFHDGIHMKEANTERLLRYLDRRHLLAKADVARTAR